MSCKTKDEKMFYYNQSSNISVWESPENLLKILIANKVDLALKPERWHQVEKLPLILVIDSKNRKFLVNLISYRISFQVPDLIFELLSERLLNDLGMLEILRKRDKPEASEAEKIGEGKMKEEPKEINSIDDLDPKKIESFNDFLRENKIRPLTRYDKEFKILKSSKDLRLKSIPEKFQEELLELYVQEEKQRMEREAEANKLKLRLDAEALMRKFMKSTTLRDNFKLFKQKYKRNLKFKKADRYFDLEKIFKNVLNEKSDSGFSAQTRNAIDGFLACLTKFKISKDTKFRDLLFEREVCEFPGLVMDDKKRIFHEFKDQLINTNS